MKKSIKYLALMLSVAVVGCVTSQSMRTPSMSGVGDPAVKIMTVATTTNILGGSSYRKAYEVSFTTTGSFTWKASSTAPAIRSVEMSYPTGVIASNTFGLVYLRNGVSRDLVGVTAPTMHTLTWYVPGDFYAMEGDVWSWSNTVAGAAILTINADFQY